jgi:hypothetical protein
MKKVAHLRKTICFAIFLAAASPSIANADTYPTATFAFPIIDQNIVAGLLNPENTVQKITVTPYIYESGNDLPIDVLAVEEGGYHVFYVSGNQPSELLNLNNDSITIQNQMFYYKIDDSDKNYVGYMSPQFFAFEPHLSRDLTNIQSTDGNLVICAFLPVGTLQSWIDLVDSYLADGSTTFSRNDVEYLDFHRQIGYADVPNFLSPSTIYSHLTDSYFRVYRTGSFFVDGPTEEEIAAEAARVASVRAAQSAADAAYALKMAPKTDLGQCYLGSDKVADPTGEIRGMLDEIMRKYGNLIK